MIEPTTHSPRATRRTLIGGTIAALLVGGAVLAYVLRLRGTAAAPPAAASASGGAMAGMNMAPDSAVHFTADQIRQFGVTFGTVKVRPLATDVRTVGTIVADETKLADVAPKFGGFVERLFVDATGQVVRRGQPLMDVYSPELVAAEHELLVAGELERTIGQSGIPGVPGGSPDFVAAARRRLQLWDISNAQIDEVLRSGQARRTLTLFAPASGVVLAKNVVEGQAIQPGQTLFTIANLSDVWMDIALREQDAGDVRVGSRAAVELTAFPGHPIDGRVAYVYPTLDTAARTVRARIQLHNPDGRLKPGMYGTVDLKTAARSALSIPNTGVLNTGERTLAFVDVGGGAFLPRDVRLGRVFGDYTEVLSGLVPGQRVVTSAQYLFDSEANIGEVMRSMIGLTGADTMRMSTPPATRPDTMPGMKMPPSPAKQR